MTSCIFEECQNSLGPEAIEIRHKGEIIGYICDTCQRGPKGFKLVLAKDRKKDTWKITQATPLNHIIE